MSDINELIRRVIQEALQVMPPAGETRNFDDLDEDEDIEGEASKQKQKDKNTPPSGEESPADKAHELGLTYKGHAIWQDKDGKSVAKTIGKDLVKLEPDGELGKSMNPTDMDDLANYSKDTQQPTIGTKLPDLAKRHQTMQAAQNIETDPAIVGHIHPPVKKDGGAIEVTVDGRNAVLDAWEPDYSSATVTFDDGTSKKVPPSKVSPKTPDDIQALAKSVAASAKNRDAAKTPEEKARDVWTARSARAKAYNTAQAKKTGITPSHKKMLAKLDAMKKERDIRDKKKNNPGMASVTGPGTGQGEVPQNFDQDLEDMGVTPVGGRRAPTKDKSGAQWQRGSLADKYLELTNGDIDKAVEKIRDTLKIDNSFKARKVLGRTLRDLAARKKEIPAGPKKEVEPSTQDADAMKDTIYQKMMGATNMADRQKHASTLSKMGTVGRPEPKKEPSKNNMGMASQVPLDKMKQSDIFPDMKPVPSPGDKPEPKKSMEKPKVDKPYYDQPGPLKLGPKTGNIEVADFEKRVKQLHPEFSPEQLASLSKLFQDYKGGVGDGNKFAKNRGSKYQRDKDLK